MVMNMSTGKTKKIKENNLAQFLSIKEGKETLDRSFSSYLVPIF